MLIMYVTQHFCFNQVVYGHFQICFRLTIFYSEHVCKHYSSNLPCMWRTIRPGSKLPQHCLYVGLLHFITQGLNASFNLSSCFLGITKGHSLTHLFKRQCSICLPLQSLSSTYCYVASICDRSILIHLFSLSLSSIQLDLSYSLYFSLCFFMSDLYIYLSVSLCFYLSQCISLSLDISYISSMLQCIKQF